MSDMFAVDHKGLKQVYRERGLSRMLGELVANAFDAPGVTCVRVVLLSQPRNKCMVSVLDNSPVGFEDFSEAFTLFAPSCKKDAPTKRGRFNFGEKWVLACFDTATIISLTGGVSFNVREGTRSMLRKGRALGTEFSGGISVKPEEVHEAIKMLSCIIPPDGVTLWCNGDPVRRPEKTVACFDATLTTVMANDEGTLMRRERIAPVELFPVAEGQVATIYELGIPVMAMDAADGDPFHINIGQKVPLSVERNNVSLAYLKRLRSLVVTHTATVLTPEQAGTRAITHGLAQADAAAVREVMASRYGEHRAIFDPSDREANNRLTSEGFTVIPPATFDKETWQSIKDAGAAIASGTLRPTPKPYGDGPNVAELIPVSEYTDGMHAFVKYAQLLAEKVCGRKLTVRFVSTLNNFSACCGPDGTMDMNVRRLGRWWFDGPLATRWEVDALLLDEFGHLRTLNHLSDAYYKALKEFGAKIGVLKLMQPELFKEFM